MPLVNLFLARLGGVGQPAAAAFSARQAKSARYLTQFPKYARSPRSDYFLKFNDLNKTCETLHARFGSPFPSACTWRTCEHIIRDALHTSCRTKDSPQEHRPKCRSIHAYADPMTQRIRAITDLLAGG